MITRMPPPPAHEMPEETLPQQASSSLHLSAWPGKGHEGQGGCGGVRFALTSQCLAGSAEPGLT